MRFLTTFAAAAASSLLMTGLTNGQAAQQLAYYSSSDNKCDGDIKSYSRQPQSDSECQKISKQCSPSSGNNAYAAYSCFSDITSPPKSLIKRTYVILEQYSSGCQAPITGVNGYQVGVVNTNFLYTCSSNGSYIQQKFCTSADPLSCTSVQLSANSGVCTNSNVKYRCVESVPTNSALNGLANLNIAVVTSIILLTIMLIS